MEELLAQAKLKKQRRENGKLSNTDRLKMLIDTNIVPVHRADIYGNIKEANDATCKLLGYTREEMYSGLVKWTDFTVPEHLERDAVAIEQLREHGRTSFYQKDYIRKDGTRVPVLILVTALDNQGIECLTLLIDQTEKRKLEEQLRASEGQLRLLAEAIPQIVWMCYPSGRIIYANQRWYDFTGLERQEDDGRIWLSVLHPDDRKKCLEEAQRAFDTDTQFNMEMRYRAADGSYRWHLVTALTIQDSKSGKKLWFGTSTDIDDRKRIAEELKESETRLKILADAIPQIVFSAKPDGQLDFFNARWFEYTGLSEEQSQNGAWQLLIHPEYLSSYMSEWKNALETGDSYEMEFRLRRAVGLSSKAYRWHLGRAVALRHTDGTILKWFATWTEIEDQRG